MLALRDLQTSFFRSIAASPGPSASENFDPPLQRVVERRGPLGPAERLDIYAQMYWARLHDVLREDFPRVATILGAERFGVVVCTYLARNPSTHPSVRHVGRGFAEFLAGASEIERLPFLADLARLEWARLAVFDAPDAQPLHVDDLRAVAPAEWPGLTFRLVPAVQLLHSAWPVHELCIEHHVHCRLVVGADGRSSSLRRQAGIELHETTPRTAGAGLLVEGLQAWQGEVEAIGTAGDVYYLVFPRPGGLARLYLLWDIARRDRFAGANRQANFLDAFRLDCLPGGEKLAAARPAGPCATYPMNDSWSDAPFTDGIVLIGDAAGWNDPIIGQGLAIAMRDARIVADVLLAGPDLSPSAFAPYAAERAERMRRLRLSAQLTTDLNATFTPEAAERRRHLMPKLVEDPSFLAPLMAPLSGPETVPTEAFEVQNFERIRALA